jgi:predicted transcriptional regulator
MPILETEEYNEIWDTSQEYLETLKTFHEKNIDADEICDLLDESKEEVEEAVDRLRDTGLVAKKTGYGDPYFKITSLGEIVLKYDKKPAYLNEMERREQEFNKVYDGDE